MATIVNNELTAEENNTRIYSPIIYIPDPNKGKPLNGAQLYFGIVGRDPTLEQNRKRVYALQEDGSAIPLEQPVLCGAGGVPEYNGSPISLSISGSYSFAALGDDNEQYYYMPRVEHANSQGFNGVIAEESQEVNGSLTLNFGVIEATTASFYISSDSTGTKFKGSFLKAGVDYTINNESSITLIEIVPDGTVVIGREMDPTGQIVPVTAGSSALFVYRDIASVKTADLQINDTVTINGGIVPGDNLGGNKYIVVAGGTGADDGESYIDLNNGNQLQAISNNLLLARYAEKTNSSNSVAGAITLDLEKGNVHKVTLSENISDIFFTNVNPDTSLTTTVTLKITQDPATPRTVTFPSSIKWAGGVAPVMTATVNSYDRFAFVTDNGGLTWDGAVIGQDFS